MCWKQVEIVQHVKVNKRKVFPMPAGPEKTEESGNRVLHSPHPQEHKGPSLVLPPQCGAWKTWNLGGEGFSGEAGLDALRVGIKKTSRDPVAVRRAQGCKGTGES